MPPEPYYQDELVTLYCGDCLAVLPELGRFDLIFTSPPYNLGTTTGGGFGHYTDDAGMRQRGGGGKWTGGALANGYDGHDDAMPQPEYETWQRQALAEMWGHLEDAGAIFYVHKPRPQRELWLPLACNPGLPLRQVVIWDRGSGVNFAPTHFVPNCEWVLIFARPSWRLKSRGASGVGDVWRVPPERDNAHPAPFPVELPARAIEAAGPAYVLDPFAGSGTTLVAAKRAGVRAVGIEKSERYCQLAVPRLAQGVLGFAS